MQPNTADAARPTGQPVVVVDQPARVELDPVLLKAQTSMVHQPQTATPLIVFDDERKQILADTIMAGATPAELDLFKLVCVRTGLDPFTRQIHAVKRRVQDNRKWIEKWSFQVAIDGFRLVAERTGKYRGQRLPMFCGEDGIWTEVWLKATPPSAAKVGVLRSDFDEPLFAIALWAEYVQTKDEYSNDGPDGGQKTGRKVPAAMWAKMPVVMLAKVAEALALRKAFPQELSGLYTADEMAQADNSDDTQPEERAARRRSATTTAIQPAVASAPVNFTNGAAILYPYGPLRDKGATLDAVYNPGATRVKKGKKASGDVPATPDETVECGGEFVVADKRLTEALTWATGKLEKHRAAEKIGETTAKEYLEPADFERLVSWNEALVDEVQRRAKVLDQAAHASAAAADEQAVERAAIAGEGEQGLPPTWPAPKA